MMRNKVFSLHLKVMFLKTRHFLFIIGILFMGISSYAQNQEKRPLPCVNKKFNIIAHVVKDSLGDPGITEADIQAGIRNLNTLFAEVCMSFKVCEYRYIDNYQYGPLLFDNESPEVDVKYHEQFRINMFFIDSMVTEPAVAGKATLGGITRQTGNHVWILKSQTMGTVIPHEMGHFFGLVHTFEDNNGRELVDGSNCTTAGDGICDTPADPFVFGDDPSKYVNDACEFYATDLLDANGDFYNPDTKNIMSYYPCACRFSKGQYLKMVETYLSNPRMW